MHITSFTCTLTLCLVTLGVAAPVVGGSPAPRHERQDGRVSEPQVGALVLLPADHTVREGESAMLSARLTSPQGLRETPWPTDLWWLFVRLAGTQENRGREDAPQPDVAGRISMKLPLAGVAMIGVDLSPCIEHWPADSLRTFAHSAGRPAPNIQDPAKPIRVRRALSATTLVRVSPAGGGEASDGTATTKGGQQAELRPLMDPTTIPVGTDLAVRAYACGDAWANGIVTAFHDASGVRREATLDAKGNAVFRIDHAGAWRLELHALRPGTDAEAAWDAVSATLTFNVPAPQPEKPGPGAPAAGGKNGAAR